MVPMRTVFTWFGLSVQFWPEAGAIEARGTGKTIGMWLGNNQAKVDGRLMRLDAAPREINSTTYVPLAFAARAMGAEVQWTEKTKTVSIRWSGRMATMRVGQRGMRTVSCG